MSCRVDASPSFRSRRLSAQPVVAALVLAGCLLSAASCTSTDEPAGSERLGDQPDSETSQGAQTAEYDDLGYGTREQPWALNTATEIVLDTLGDADGSVWSVTVGEPSDATDRVVDSSIFNEAPGEGVVFAVFALDMMLLDANKVPLSAGWNLTWEIFGGATNTVYDAFTLDVGIGCGSFDDEFSIDAEAYPGGTLSGEVCIPLPVEDLEHPGTQIALSPMFGDRVMFAANGAPAPLPRTPVMETGVGSGSGEGTRAAPHPFGTTVTLTLDGFSGNEDSVWDLSVGSPRDVTAAVLAESQFSDEPRDGHVYAGFDVSLTLVEADSEPAVAGWGLSWEIHGGESLRVFKELWCLGDALDLFTDVLIGGNVSGVVCVAVPAEDLDSPSTQVALNQGSGNRIFFN